MNFGRRLSHDAGGAFLDLLLLTAEPNPDVVLPSLSLLAHTLRTAPPDVSSLLEAGSADILMVDAGLDRTLDPGGSRGQRGRPGGSKRRLGLGRDPAPRHRAC